MTRKAEHPLVLAMPGIFVGLWATGFIGAKYGLPYSEPFTFLSLRFLAVLLVVAAIALSLRPGWPGRRAAVWSMLVGMLIHGAYLGGVFWAIEHGMPAGVSAVIVGTQPLLTAALSGPLLSERVSGRQWLGLGLGLCGVLAVLAPRLELAGSGINAATVAACLAALLGITLGTLLQRAKAGGIPLWTGALLQYLGALLVTGPAALLLESRTVTWTMEFILALAWLSIVLSIGAISLLVVMLRRGAVARTAALFYLVPPVAALLAFALFGEALGPVQIAGMAVTAFGVWLAAARGPAGAPALKPG